MSSKTETAKSRIVCGGLCAYFFLFSNISSVLSINDDAHKIISLPQDISKEGRQHQSVTNSPTRTTEYYDNTTGDGVTPTEANIFTNETDLGVEPKEVAHSTNSTKIVDLDSVLKNLDVNGTGQKLPLTNQSSDLGQPSIEDESDQDNPAINSTPSFDEKQQQNVICKEDNHTYYNSSSCNDPELGRFYWVDLSNRSDVLKVNDLSLASYRKAKTVKLSFEFPFYGHVIKIVTITPVGFLYTGEYVDSWLAATQYIAPLMANFDTSISDDSIIRYADNGTAFTVEWKVSLKDNLNVGEFIFQTTLHKNGDIVFVYRNMPLLTSQIGDEQHPVKVGLSDAYVIDRIIFFVRRKTIHEYHRINFLKEDIKNWTVIYLKALPTCLQSTDCITCATKKIPSFDCQWCPSINKCSNGLDRHRQEWITKSCEKKQINNESLCSHVSGIDIFDDNNRTFSHDATEFEHHKDQYSSKIYNSPIATSPKPVKMGFSGIVAILFLMAMVAGISIWILYAYRNPHTTSGQILIRYRPSQWRWRRGEARYTAATIHM